MKIFIITMDDPLFTIPYLKKVIAAKQESICGIALVTKGNRITVRKNQSRLNYLTALFIILGPAYYLTNAFKTLSHKILKKLAPIFGFSSPCILEYARKMKIPAFVIPDPNDKIFLDELKKLEPDVIINQAQNILKKDLLSIPKTGVINRHNALLPRNRGRLTPFWVKYKNENETGSSIHFVTEGIDAGPIIHQERFAINKNEKIKDIVNKNYQYAFTAMMKALEKLENNCADYLPNNDSDATYNSVPGIKDAIKFRLGKKYTV